MRLLVGLLRPEVYKEMFEDEKVDESDLQQWRPQTEADMEQALAELRELGVI